MDASSVSAQKDADHPRSDKNPAREAVVESHPSAKKRARMGHPQLLYSKILLLVVVGSVSQAVRSTSRGALLRMRIK
jgi:hypothetical protein